MGSGKFRSKFVGRAKEKQKQAAVTPPKPQQKVTSGIARLTQKARQLQVPASPPKPTDDQQKVIGLAPDARVFVNAGPGTGKTYTLIERIKHLISKHDLEPASEILVLSFSVSAVAEVKKRLTEAVTSGACPDKALFLDIRTFDSFATRFLRQKGTAEELRGKSYDERIRMAIEAFKSGGASGVLPPYKHVFIDEVQDLVSGRADLAFEVLKHANCGFTLLGDPAQGIYDFQIDNEKKETTSEAFLASVRSHFKLKPDVVLQKNHRVAGSSDLETIAVKGRALILESTSDAYDYLVSEYSGLSKKGDLRAPGLSREDAGDETCVLCRDNGQVLVLAGALRKKEIPFVVQQSKTTVTTPAWIGRTFFGFEQPKLAEEDFKALLREKTGMVGETATALWESLTSNCTKQGNKRVSVEDLRIALNELSVFPDPENEVRSKEALRLSTIHRSKGREFESVIVVMDGDGRETAEARGVEFDTDGESKVMFVGLTRARKKLARMEPASMYGLWKPGSGDRWVRSRTKDKMRQFLGVEVGLEGDCDGDSFAHGKVSEVIRRQEFLWQNRSKPFPVYLVYAGRSEGCPQYVIHHDKLRFGTMSNRFGWDLYRLITSVQGKKPRKFPGVIEGLWSRAVVTEIGNTAAPGVDKSFLKSGLWLGIRMQGLGVCYNWSE